MTIQKSPTFLLKISWFFQNLQGKEIGMVGQAPRIFLLLWVTNFDHEFNVTNVKQFNNRKVFGK